MSNSKVVPVPEFVYSRFRTIIRPRPTMNSQQEQLYFSGSTQVDSVDPTLLQNLCSIKTKANQAAISEVREPKLKPEQPIREKAATVRIDGPPPIECHIEALLHENAETEEPVLIQESLHVTKLPESRNKRRQTRPKGNGEGRSLETTEQDDDNGCYNEEQKQEDEEDGEDGVAKVHGCGNPCCKNALPCSDPSHCRNPWRCRNGRHYYGTPRQRPKSWGRKTGNNHTFQYSDLGALENRGGFSRSELCEYLYARPLRPSDRWVDRQILPGERVVKGKSRHGLTLWIGFHPARGHDRFDPSPGDCCFGGCAAKKRKFRGGQVRVAFDERMNTDGAYHDPLHVAGWMHLFCLEQQFDILELVEDLDIRLDDRKFHKEEINPIGIGNRDRGSRRMDAARLWLGQEWHRKVQWHIYLSGLREEFSTKGKSLTLRQVMRPRNFDDSLTKALTVCDVLNYSQGGQGSRKKRKDNATKGKTIADAENHLGNISWYQGTWDQRNSKSPIDEPDKVKTRRCEDTAVRHRIYEVADFTKGFVPASMGHSSWDALGIAVVSGFNYPERNSYNWAQRPPPPPSPPPSLQRLVYDHRTEINTRDPMRIQATTFSNGSLQEAPARASFDPRDISNTANRLPPYLISTYNVEPPVGLTLPDAPDIVEKCYDWPPEHFPTTKRQRVEQNFTATPGPPSYASISTISHTQDHGLVGQGTVSYPPKRRHNEITVSDQYNGYSDTCSQTTIPPSAEDMPPLSKKACTKPEAAFQYMEPTSTDIGVGNASMSNMFTGSQPILYSFPHDTSMSSDSWTGTGTHGYNNTNPNQSIQQPTTAVMYNDETFLLAYASLPSMKSHTIPSADGGTGTSQQTYESMFDDFVDSATISDWEFNKTSDATFAQDLTSLPTITDDQPALAELDEDYSETYANAVVNLTKQEQVPRQSMPNKQRSFTAGECLEEFGEMDNLFDLSANTGLTPPGL